MSSAASTHNVPASGISHAKLGIWLFLASEVMLFATLFTSYIVLRVASPTWPKAAEELNVPLAMLNTFVLITSSVTMVMAYVKTYERNLRGFRMYMGATLALSVVFLIIKAIEYSTKFAHHHYPSTSPFFAVYFTLTGLHGLHVIGGMVLNGYLTAVGRKQWDHPLFLGRVECAGLYWHFVDIVWIFLFPGIYLL